MEFEWIKIPYALLTLFIVVNYGMLLGAFIQKIGARVGRRHGVSIFQNYFDLIKNYGLRTSITHGVMFYLGPVFRLSGGVGLLLFGRENYARRGRTAPVANGMRSVVERMRAWFQGNF